MSERTRLCGCKVWCTDLPEERDHPLATCKGLRLKPYWLGDEERSGEDVAMAKNEPAEESQ